MTVTNAEQEQNRLLKREGFDSFLQLQMQPKRLWYRENGSVVGELPVDPYHFQRFTTRGWTLVPPGRRHKKVKQAPVLAPPEPVGAVA